MVRLGEGQGGHTGVKQLLGMLGGLRQWGLSRAVTGHVLLVHYVTAKKECSREGKTKAGRVD